LVIAVIYIVLHCFVFFFQETNDSSIKFYGTNLDNFHKEDLPSDPEGLIDWATQAFGGVTSFTTVRNPATIYYTGQEGDYWQYLKGRWTQNCCIHFLEHLVTSGNVLDDRHLET